MKKLFVVFASVLLIAACGDDGSSGNNSSQNNSAKNNSSNNNNPREGYTSCGNTNCDPSTYCSKPAFSVCEAGCVNGDNCTSGQTCSKEGGEDVGACEDTTNPKSQLERCKDACEVLVACGVVPASSGCNKGCKDQADDSGRKAVADCVLNWGSADSCGSEPPTCLDNECGPSYPCSGDADCVGGSCL